MTFQNSVIYASFFHNILVFSPIPRKSLSASLKAGEPYTINFIRNTYRLTAFYSIIAF